MNLGANGGSFTGSFMDLKKNGTTQFAVLNNGSISSLGNIAASGTLTVIGTTTLGVASVNNGLLSLLSEGNAFSTTLRSSSTQSSSLTFTLPGSLGSAGQMLTTDGTGGLSFTTLSGLLSGGINGLLARWTSGTTLSTGLLVDNGTVAGVNATSSSYTFTVRGSSATNPFNVASSSGTSLLTVLANGNVGIGSSTPGAKLSIVGAEGQPAFIVASSSGEVAFAVNSAGYVSIGTTSPVDSTTTVPLRVAGDIRIGNSGTNGCIQGNGGATLTGTCVSDQNLKTNIFDINNVSEKFQALRVINFNWNSLANATYGNDMNTTNTGYLAQNVESLFPELVITDSKGFKQVNYSAMSLYTAEGVKELSLIASDASTTLATLGATVANNYSEASSTFATLMGTITSNYTEASTTINALQSQLSSITNTLNITGAATNSLSIITIGSSTDAIAIGIGTTTPTYTFTIVSHDDINPFAIASSSGLNLLTVLSSGDVGIGTSTPGARLDVYKNTTDSDTDILRVISDVGSVGNVKFRVDSDGDVFTDGATTIGTPADLAENYPTNEPLIAGTVVTFATTTEEWSLDNKETESNTYQISTIRKARGGDVALGVISTRPGILLGGNTKNGTPVAFSGRVPVLVTNENGSVKQGDYLTISTSSEGYAMRATENGDVIGRAISDASTTLATTTVLMVVENRYHPVTLSSVEGLTALATSSEIFAAPTKSVYDTLVEKLSHSNTVVVEYFSLTTKAVAGYFDKLFAKEIYTDKVCVKKADGTNVCLNGDQVEGMLNSVQIPLMTAPAGNGNTGSSTSSGNTSSTAGNASSTGTGTIDASSTPLGNNSTSTVSDASTTSSGGGVGSETPPALDPTPPTSDQGTTPPATDTPVTQ
jgi:hypothetical protein